MSKYQSTDLARLCRYYLACMEQDEVKVSVSACSKDGDPDYHSLSGIPVNTRVLFSQEGAGRLLNKVRGERGPWALYLGYPTSLKSRRLNWQSYMVEPVLLFPIDIDSTTKEAHLDLDYPIINQKALQAYSSVEKESLMEACVQLGEELGIGDADEVVGLDELALKLQSIRPEWPWRGKADPDNLVVEPPLDRIREEGIFNRAVVIMAQRSPFTVGLEAELKLLAKLPENKYSSTALGRWISESIPAANEVAPDDDLIEVLPMNLEQRQAVSSALASPLTIVTGPPGTGKSQVVTNILVNAAWRGQKVLFASKNNKAVDVVETLVNNLGPRPILIRLGAQAYQTKLAEYLIALLSATATREDAENYQEAKDIYQQLQNTLKQLDEETANLINLRNQVDRLEKESESTRAELPDDMLDRLEAVGISQFVTLLDSFRKALYAADRDHHGFFRKLFWKSAGKRYFAAVNERIPQIAKLGQWSGLSAPHDFADDLNLSDWVDFSLAVGRKLELSGKLNEYLIRLRELQKSRQLPELSLQKLEVLEEMASNSERLWQYWLKLQPRRLSRDDRQLLSRYTALLKMVMDAGPKTKFSRDVYRQYSTLFSKASHLLPCLAVTALSIKGKVPFEGAFFDIVVFDEASQCDIASVLPLLFRAKKVIVIGDPKQLSHISGLQRGQDQQLLSRFGLVSDYPHWSYSTNSLYDLAVGLVSGDQVRSLLDHHRSHSDVIGFSNEQFYENQLRVATNYDSLKRVYENEPGVRWEHVSGNVVRPANGGALNSQEVKAIARVVRHLVMERKYQGSIGVVSPFRAQANAIRVAIEKQPDLGSSLEDSDFLVDTVHSFQGDERDIIIFSPVVSAGVSPGAIRFLEGNGNLFNVAITRARAQLIVVGDIDECDECGIDYLSNFAKYAVRLKNASASGGRVRMEDLGESYPIVSNPEQVSDWEKRLYEALYKAGVKTLPQYREEKYILDFAVFEGERRLNIEVDGERYHRNWSGELCRRDQIRNQRMFELGWDVIRFWVYEVRDDMEGCINKIQKWRLPVNGAEERT